MASPQGRLTQIVQVVSIEEVPIMLGSVSFQSKEGEAVKSLALTIPCLAVPMGGALAQRSQAGLASHCSIAPPIARSCCQPHSTAA
eukprot:scaffold227873_cov39-Tisochrysis_lutea.AAC.3